jgi:hypothetical protein
MQIWRHPGLKAPSWSRAVPFQTYCRCYITCTSNYHSTGSAGSNQPATRDSHGVYGFINGQEAFAAVATESRFNVISRGMAESYHLPITKASSALGEITSVGRCTAMWEFDRDVMDNGPVDFHVLADCPKSIVFGLPFLLQTKTLTRNWHRLRARQIPASPEPVPSVHFLDSVGHRIAGQLHGTPVLALPATGSDVNIVSGAFIRSQNLSRKVRQHERQCISLIDGREEETKGSIGLRWRFGNESLMKSWYEDFVVLEDSPYDVTLGRSLLYASNAYLAYTEYFRELGSHSKRSRHVGGMFHICSETSSSGIPGPLFIFGRGLKRKYSKFIHRPDHLLKDYV